MQLNQAHKQFIRFVVAGGFVTFLSAAIYWLLTHQDIANPVTANAIAHMTGLVVAYFIHGLWSFAGHGTAIYDPAAITKFATVSLTGFALNNLWIWLTTTLAGGPDWAPIPLMVSVTPVVSFLLNRFWVFQPKAAPDL